MKRDENNNKIRSNNTEITIPAISNKPIHNIDANLNKSCKLDDIFMVCKYQKYAIPDIQITLDIFKYGSMLCSSI